MRNALYQGKSTTLLKELSQEEIFKEAIGNVNIKRMKDRYLIVRFLGFYFYFEKQIDIEYKSDIDDFLGKIMNYINSLNDDSIENLRNIFITSMNNVYNILGKDSFRIPDKRKKRPVNMALFESLSYLMSFKIVKKYPNEVTKKINLLFQDEEFLNSLTNRIDSSKSVNIRFTKMKNILKDLNSAE